MSGTVAMPTFIGSFRSGTTLLANLLGLHPAIAPWFETKYLCEALRWLRVLNHPDCAEFESRHVIPSEPGGFSPDAVAARMRHDLRATAARISGQMPSGKMAHERYPIGYDCVLYSLAEAEAAFHDWCSRCLNDAEPANIASATGDLIRLLGQLHARRAGKNLWVNKTPGIPRFIPELRQCLGPCRMVLLIRNGRDVVRSASHLGWAQAIEIAEWWKVLIEETRAKAAPHPEEYLEMRYEDLVQDPEAAVDRLLGFMGLAPLGKQLVEEYRRLMGRDVFQSKRPMQQKPAGGIDWTAFDALAGNLMRQLGYE